MIKQQNKRAEEKIKELQNFIARFSANKSKSKQATSRRKLIDKLTVEELPASSRKYPYIAFDMEREVGKDILQVTGLSKTVDGVKVLNNVSFTVGKGDKIAFVGNNEIAVTTLFKILMEEMEPDEGTFKWGSTTSVSYFPNDNSAFFDNCQLSIIDWMRQYSKDETESYLRGFLGRMLFSGDDVFKQVNVLSGGEKAFVAIALYFAILKVRPTPFCMLDEIDAALDDRNVERFASYLHTLSDKTQFIVITHRRGTMEAADVLYGVTMQEQGVSKILRLSLDELAKQLGITA